MVLIHLTITTVLAQASLSISIGDAVSLADASPAQDKPG